jgi:hypothetical protein
MKKIKCHLNKYMNVVIKNIINYFYFSFSNQQSRERQN